MHFKRDVGSEVGSSRRLPAYPPAPFNLAPLRLHSGRQSFLFQGPPVRSVYSPLGIYKINESSQEKVKDSRYSHHVFPRRFHHPGKELPRGFRSHLHCDLPSPKSGSHHQLEEVFSGSCQEVGISRCGDRPGFLNLLSPPVQSGQGEDTDSVHFCPIPKKKGLRLPCRFPELRSGLSSTRKTPPKTHSKMGECQFLPSSEIQGDSSGWHFEGSTSPLGKIRLPGTDHPYSDEIPDHHSDDGLVGSVMGGGSVTSQGSGRLESFSVRPTHQLEGTQGSPPFSHPFPPFVEREMRQPQGRQHCSPGLPQETRFPEIFQPLGSLQGDFRAHPSSGHHSSAQAHQGSPERPCGQRFEVAPYRDRVVPGQGDFPVSVQSVWEFCIRLFRHLGQQTVPLFRFPMPRPQSMGGGRVLVELEQDHLSNLRLPSRPTYGPASPPFEGFPRERRRDRILLAIQALVHPPFPEMPQELPPPRGLLPPPGDLPGDCHPPPGFRLNASRLGAIEDVLTGEGFSGPATDRVLECHRPKTVASYQRIWTRFLEFLDRSDIPHSSVKSCHVANFLSSELTERDLKYRTVAAYKCALQLPLILHFNLDVSEERLSRFMQGVFNLRPPSRDQRMPVWLLDDLLSFLCSDTFEPLDHKPFSIVKRKTLVLLLLASGRRSVEIANLSRKSRWQGRGPTRRLFLDWLPDFFPKASGPDFMPDPPSILRAVGNGDLINFICPVRAFQIFLAMRNRKSNRFDDRCLWTTKQATLDRDFKSVVLDSRIAAGKTQEVLHFPHMSKKLAVSYSLMYFPNLVKDLPKRVGNKGLRVLKKHYLSDDVPPLNHPVVLPLGMVTPAVLG